MSYSDNAITKRLPNIEEVLHEMRMIPDYSPEDYLVHPKLGMIYSFVSGKWMLSNNPVGVGDKGYLLTKLRRKLDDGSYVSVPVYVHWAVFSAIYGRPINEIRHSGFNGELMEIDHIDRNVKNNNYENLRLVSSKENKENSSNRYWNKVRLSKELAAQIRDDFKSWTGTKLDFYKAKAAELNVTFRSVQNVVLSNTYKEITE
ncbi:HNH endonuclease [Sutcliffiella horikoshii]|uniref:HNH nuclease domain-containing protein n=1 Tax=Sutcliffiella horikoshii TaxID=79883 RepID=A0A5D4TKB7_9BACI|nr:HNH endonuclease [Sutcliffiella horikoshii]TYS74506.1 hypothetical protein FZC75_02075 [Sutcliffiella horikoshii]